MCVRARWGLPVSSCPADALLKSSGPHLPAGEVQMLHDVACFHWRAI